MKFLALFAAGAVAQSTVQGLISEIGTINGKVASLDSAIKAITGPESKDAVLAASADVLNELATGTTYANGLATLSLGDALAITPSVNALSDAVNTAINDIIAKKDLIVASGLGGTTLAQLQQQQTAGTAFANAITAKVPTEAQPIAASLSKPILDNLARGVAAFQGLTDSTGGSSSSSSAVASSSSAVASSSAAVTTSAAVITSSYAASTITKATTSASASYNATKPTTSVPYTGAAATNVAAFGAVAVAALVAAF